LFAWRGKTIAHKTAIFRQVNKVRLTAHHDVLEFPDGQIVLLTVLVEGQRATVLQLPAEPKTESEAEAQERAVTLADRQRCQSN
jgi:endonuclease/exonuclease/phosphatase (EEP) superfamily protein YafD